MRALSQGPTSAAVHNTNLSFDILLHMLTMTSRISALCGYHWCSISFITTKHTFNYFKQDIFLRLPFLNLSPLLQYCNDDSQEYGNYCSSGNNGY